MQRDYKRGYNLAVIIVRAVALACVALGLMWLANVVLASVLYAVHAPDWLMNGLWAYGFAGLSAPLWLLGGLIALRYSDRLARFIASATRDDGPDSTRT